MLVFILNEASARPQIASERWRRENEKLVDRNTSRTLTLVKVNHGGRANNQGASECQGPQFGEALVSHSTYLEFDIQTFELGHNLWHASVTRTDGRPIVLQSMPFEKIEIGFAWSSPIAALEDAKRFIDRLVRRLSERT